MVRFHWTSFGVNRSSPQLSDCQVYFALVKVPNGYQACGVHGTPAPARTRVVYWGNWAEGSLNMRVNDLSFPGGRTCKHSLRERLQTTVKYGEDVGGTLTLIPSSLASGRLRWSSTRKT